MCGIVGLFYKSPELEPRARAHLAAMLVQMSDRGPDSSGVAVYRDPAPSGSSKLTLYSLDPARCLGRSRGELAAVFGGAQRGRGCGAKHAVHRGRGGRGGGAGAGSRAPARPAGDERGPGDRDLQGGRAGRRSSSSSSRLGDFGARHGLGHTRMATESRVTTEGSHPFSTGLDLCLVHNGSLSNHNRLRERLRREGIEFQTENDTEVAAGYLTWRMREGASLEEALEGLPRRSRRLLHVPGRHGRWLRGAARPDRVQARGARRDRRLGRDGVRVPGDRRAARAPRTRASGSPSRASCTHGRRSLV